MTDDTPQEPLTIADLMALLQKYPQEMPVVYRCFSEHMLLAPNDIGVAHLSLPRPDGWVHDARPDKPKTPYLVFPGN